MCIFASVFIFLYVTFFARMNSPKQFFYSYGRICYRANKDEVLSKLAEWGIDVSKE